MDDNHAGRVCCFCGYEGPEDSPCKPPDFPLHCSHWLAYRGCRGQSYGYQEWRAWRLTTEQFPLKDASLGTTSLVYPVLGLAGEAGECVELIKKAWRSGQRLDGEALAAELGDVLWYVDALACRISHTIPSLLEGNRAKLTARRAAKQGSKETP